MMAIANFAVNPIKKVNFSINGLVFVLSNYQSTILSLRR
jgi:hypothetical protein